MRDPEVFLQEDLLLKEGDALLALEHVGNCCVAFQRLFRCQGCLAFLAFEHMLRSSVNFKGLSTLAFEAAVFAFLLM